MGKIRLTIDDEGQAVLRASVKVKNGLRQVYVKDVLQGVDGADLRKQLAIVMGNFLGEVERARNTASEPNTGQRQ